MALLYILLTISALIFLYFKANPFKKKRTKQLSTTQADASQVPEATRQAVWDLFKRSFVNEFKGFKDFDDYLLTRSLLLFHDTTREKQLQGFIIFHIVDRVVDGRELTVVVGDFFTVTADYRRQSTPIYALLRLCIATKLKNPSREMYYFFITYSFKSYLSFSRSMGEFYPCRVRPTPPFEQRVLDLLGTESAGDWGTYNPRTCVIESLAVKQGSSTGGVEEGHLSDLARSRPRDLSTTWMWFAQQNPNFAKGDCLCVLCSIDLKNMLHGAKNSLFRALGLGSKRMTQPNKPLSFGMAETRADEVQRKEPESFMISVKDEELDDLTERLEKARWPDQLELAPDAKWSYGTDVDYMKQLTKYWANDYLDNWKMHEKRLNQFPHYKIELEDRQVHFIHVKSTKEDAIPIILLHGWPGSFYEFHKIIGPLTRPEKHGGKSDYAFHVVVPSLPGYGWSEAPLAPGYDVQKVANLMVSLMETLGYKQYVAQGGDWGHLVAAHMAIIDAQRCLAIHLNMVAVEPRSPIVKAKVAFDVIFQRWRLTAKEREWLNGVDKFLEEETGYIDIQATKPQTIGYALHDSPTGLAAWIIEKFRSWSDCNGDVATRFSKDDLLTNVMIYWLTGTVTSAARLYYESKKSGNFASPPIQVPVPAAIAVYPKEILRPPRRWVEYFYTVKRWTEMPAGGHFPALEEPDSLVADIRAFFCDDLRLHDVFTAS